MSCVQYNLTYFRFIIKRATKPKNIKIKGNRTKNQDTLVYPAEQR
jgi:hypothetical protein